MRTGNRTKGFEWYHFQWPSRKWPVTQISRSRHNTDAEYLRNGRRYRQGLTRSTQGCHFKWPWVILSDLEWLSEIFKSIARSLCNSWASCCLYKDLPLPEISRKFIHTWYTMLIGWWRGTVLERRSLTSELSLSCARPTADGWPLMWVNRPL